MAVPAVLPVTTPVLSTVATVALVVLQLPPVPVVVRVVALVAQTLLAPVTVPDMAAGLMVMP